MSAARGGRTAGAFLLIVVLFGSAFPAIKVGLAYAPPLVLAALRYYLSAALLLGDAGATQRYWTPRTGNDRAAVLAGGVLFIGGTGLTFVGVQFTTSGVATIIFGLIPVLTVLVGWFLLPTERLSRRSLVGVAVGFVGVGIVIGPRPGALADAAALGVTLGTVLVRRARPSMPVVALTGWAMLVGATVQLAFSVALGESVAAVRVTTAFVLILAYLSVLASGVGFVLYFELIDRVGVLEVNLVTYLNPVVALLLDWALLDEPVPTAALVGLLVVFAGFVLLKEKELAAELAKYRGAVR